MLKTDLPLNAAKDWIAPGRFDLCDLISIEVGKPRLYNWQGEPIVQPAPPSFPRRFLRALKR